MSQAGNVLYEFSDFRLDIRERLLKRNGTPIPVPEKAFQMLSVLVQEAGHLVTKKEMMSRVWPDTFVEENSLDKNVSLLRQVLGERNGKHKFIETVRGHGYRFVADVRMVETGAPEKSIIAGVPVAISQASTVPQSSGVSAKILFAALLFGVIALFVGWKSITSRKEQHAKVPSRTIESLAVLPLKNLSPDTSQEYFADGMTEELITKLAGFASIRVISRTSVMEYKNATKNIPQIAKELNVDAILEGSVLQAGNRIRISMQLIDGKTDTHLWAKSYERDFRDILALQDEIAAAITHEVQARITLPEAGQLAKAPGVDSDAYQAYLRGLYYLERELNEENLQLAVQMFEKAVDLDTHFAVAYAQLSRVHSYLYFLYDPVPERLTRSKDAVDKAFELRPGLAEAHLALGTYYYCGARDHNLALEQLKIAEKRLPNHRMLLGMQRSIYRRQGRWTETRAAEQKLVSISPRHAFTMFDTGLTFFLLRRYPEAQSYYERCISFGPDENNGYVGSAVNLLHWKGDTAAAREILRKGPDKNDPWFIHHVFWVEFLDRNYEEALKVLSSPFADPLQKHVFTGLVYSLMGRQNLARRSFETARERILEQDLQRESADYSVHGLYGLTLAGLGEKEEAVREGKRAVELLPVSEDAVSGPNRIETLAVIYTLTGDHDAAINELQHLLSIPARFSVAMLRIDPLWDPLRNHPGFKKLLEMQAAPGTNVP